LHFIIPKVIDILYFVFCISWELNTTLFIWEYQMCSKRWEAKTIIGTEALPLRTTNLCRCPRAGGKVKGQQSRSKVEEGAADTRAGAVTPMMNNKMSGCV
jgi:hypothetical protein